MLVLRKFAEEELSYFDHLPGAAEDPLSSFGEDAAASAAIRARWAEHGLIGEGHGTLAVEVDQVVIGDVEWHTVAYGPPPDSNAYNIGIRLLREHRGLGHGSVAQSTLATYLFAEFPINRVEAGTDIANVAEQRALERAGFVREGIVRGAQWRNGRWHDLVLYARLRSDAGPE